MSSPPSLLPCAHGITHTESRKGEHLAGAAPRPTACLERNTRRMYSKDAMITRNRLIAKLTSYFLSRSDVAFAYLFGSWAKGYFQQHSDLDIAIYFYPAGGELEVEDEVFYPGEDSIWADVDSISGTEVDLLVLNRAPARVGFAAISEGISLRRDDNALFWKYALTAGHLFEEYADFTSSFLEIKARSLSLPAADKDRLLRTLDFLVAEIEDHSQFAEMDFQKYSKNSALRRNVERWIENQVSASIDIAKILISSEKQVIPQTYRDTVTRLKTLPGFDDQVVERISQNIRLRNFLAHEYLDIRFKHILRFVQDSPSPYREFVTIVKSFVSREASDRN